MELPRGYRPPNKIQCPVVKDFKKRYIRENGVPRLEPDPNIKNVQYDPNITLAQVAKQYVLLALQRYNGSILQAAKMLGIGKNTVYGYLGKRYGKQYEKK